MKNSNTHFIFVCKKCPAQESLLKILAEKTQHLPDVCVQDMRCTGACDHREKHCGLNSIAFNAKGKDGYLFHLIKDEPSDIDLILEFFRVYYERDDGLIRLKFMTHPDANAKYFIARIPAIDKN